MGRVTNDFFMSQPIGIKNNKQSKILFGLSVFTLSFVLLFKSTDIYKYAFVGAIFEAVWLIIIAAVFIIPVIALWILYKNKFSYKSLCVYALLISVGSILLLFI